MATESAAPAGAAKQSGVIEDILEVLYAPSLVFDRTRNAKVMSYLLVTTAFVLIVMLATKNLVDPWMEAQADLSIRLAAENGKPVPDEAIGATRAFMSWGFLATAVFVTLLGPLVNGLLLLLGSKVGGAKLTFGQASVIAALGGIPRLFNYIAMPVQGLLLDAEKARSVSDFSLGPARFVDPATTPPPLLALLASIDVTRVWQFVLTGIGVAVVARVSKGNGFIAAAIMLALGTILQLLPTALA